jgi:hypothetical protein
MLMVNQETSLVSYEFFIAALSCESNLNDKRDLAGTTR